MQPTQNKRTKLLPFDSQEETGNAKSVDNTRMGKKSPWEIVDAIILSDEEMVKCGAPEEWTKIALDNGWHPFGFRIKQPEAEQRVRTFNDGIDEFDQAWAKYAGIPKLFTRPGPNVRNVVVEWAKQMRNQTGINGSPIKMICLLNFKCELVDRSTPVLMSTQVEESFIPACVKATQEIKKRQVFFESICMEEDLKEDSTMYRVIFKKALQDAYPAVKLPILVPKDEPMAKSRGEKVSHIPIPQNEVIIANEKVARSEEEKVAFLVAMSIDEDSAMHRKFFELAMQEESDETRD